MSKLKVWGGCFDGRNRVIIAANTKKEAVEALQRVMVISRYHFDQFSSETGHAEELATATASPGTVFSRNVNGHEPFTPVRK